MQLPGAIYAHYGDLQVYDSTFESNTANNVRTSDDVPRNFVENFDPIPGGGHASICNAPPPLQY
jgi:hypothetical protein